MSFASVLAFPQPFTRRIIAERSLGVKRSAIYGRQGHLLRGALPCAALRGRCEEVLGKPPGYRDCDRVPHGPIAVVVGAWHFERIGRSH